MKKVFPITLVIADTGPLLNLAVIDRLDILQSFGRPVYVTDVVKYECMRYESRPGVDVLQKWLSDDCSNQRKIINTPLGPAYLAARDMEDAGHRNATENIGEWSMSWVMNNLNSILMDLHLPHDEHVGLLLIDDNSFAKGFHPHHEIPKNAHILSTRALFISLEKLGIIESALDLREEIKNNGRPRLTKAIHDIPAKIGSARSDYFEGMKGIIEGEESLDNDDDDLDQFNPLR